MYPRNEGAEARTLWNRLHVVATQSAGAASRPRTASEARQAGQAQIASGPAVTGIADQGSILHSALHNAVAGLPAPGAAPAHDVWSRLHYWAQPGRSGDAIAFGEAKADSFRDGQVIKGPDGAVVAYGQVGTYARASGVAAAWGETHGEMWNAQGSAWARAELSAMAYARGAFVKTKDAVMAMGESVAELVARAEAGARGSAGVGSRLFQVDAGIQGATEVGARSNAAGIAYVGLDSLGLPAFELGGQAAAMGGSRAQGMAQAAVSLLGLIKVRVGAVAQGMAGAAGGILGHFKMRDGDFALRLGGSAAAGIGGNVATEVGVELGTLPKGVLMTTVAPIVQAPILLINSIGKLFGQKDKPGEYTPDITDFPKLAAATFVGGIRMVGQGAVEIAQDVGNGVVAAGEGLATGAKFVGKTAVDAVVGVGEGIGTGVKFIGNTVASLFKGW